MRAREKSSRRPRWSARALGRSEATSARGRLVRAARLLWPTALLLALVTGVPPRAIAQERTTLIRVLESAHDFRARVRAALALGSTHDSTALAPLSAALGADDNAAVRAACASALGSLGELGALPALRRALSDSSSDVRDAVEDAIRALGTTSPGSRASTGAAPPSAGSGSTGGRIDWGTTRWLVVIGSMENRSTFTHERLETLLEREVHGGLSSLGGVAVVDGEAPHADADAEAARRDLPELRVEGSIREIEHIRRDEELRVSCDVSVLVLDEPGRNIRASLTATATAAEEAESGSARTAQERRLAEAACEAAVERAMGGAARALASAH